MSASKIAVLYGGGCHVGGTVARAFAREGAWVMLTGRTLEPLDQLADEVVSDGGKAETAQVDATDPARARSTWHPLSIRRARSTSR